MPEAPVNPDGVLSKLNDLASLKKRLEQQVDTVLRARDTYGQMREQYLRNLEEVRLLGLQKYPHLLGLLEQYSVPELQRDLDLEKLVSTLPQQATTKRLVGPYVLKAIDEVPGGLTQQQIFEKLRGRFTPEEIKNALNNNRIFLIADEHGQYTVTGGGRRRYIQTIERAESEGAREGQQLIQPEASAPQAPEQPLDVSRINMRAAVLRIIKENPNIDLENLAGKLPGLTRSQVYDAEYALFQDKLIKVEGGKLSVTEAGEARLSKPAHGDLAAKIRARAGLKTKAVLTNELEKTLGVDHGYIRDVLTAEGWQNAFGRYFVPGEWVRNGAPERSLLEDAIATGASLPSIERNLRAKGIYVSTETIRKYMRGFGLALELASPEKLERPKTSELRMAIKELPKDRAALVTALISKYGVVASHVHATLREEGWKNVFDNYYVCSHTFGEETDKGLMQKAFEAGKTLASAQEYLNGIGISVHDYIVADLASEFELLDLEAVVKEAGNKIGLDYELQSGLSTTRAIIRAMQALKRSGKTDTTINDLKIVLPEAHRTRLHFAIYDLIKNKFIEKISDATYKLTDMGDKFAAGERKRTQTDAPYKFFLPIADVSEEGAAAGLHALFAGDAGLESVIAEKTDGQFKFRAVNIPGRLDLRTAILYVIQKAGVGLSAGYFALALAQKYENADVLSEIENLKASDAIGVDAAGNLLIKKGGRMLLESELHMTVADRIKILTERVKENAIRSSDFARRLGVNRHTVSKQLKSAGWQLVFDSYYLPPAFVGEGKNPEQYLFELALRAGKTKSDVQNYLARLGMEISKETIRRKGREFGISFQGEPEEPELEDVLETAELPEMPLTDFDRKVIAGLDGGPKIALYVMYVNDKKSRGAKTEILRMNDFIPKDKQSSAEVGLRRHMESGNVERSSRGVYKLTDKGRKFLEGLFNERYLHEAAGQALPLPEIDEEIAKQLSSQREKITYAAFLLGRGGVAFGSVTLEKMLGEISPVHIKNVLWSLAGDGLMTHVDGTQGTYHALTEKGINALGRQFSKAGQPPIDSAQPPAAPSVPSLLDGLAVQADAPAQVQASSAIVPAPAEQHKITEAQPQGPTQERRKAVSEKVTRFWNDHKIPVSESLIGQIMNGDGIEPFLGKEVRRERIGGKNVFVPRDMGYAALERWRALHAMAVEYEGQPMSIEDAAIVLHVDTDTIRAMAHGLKRSGLVDNNINLVHSEKINIHDPETIRKRVDICLRFGGTHSITTTDLMNMTGLSADSLLARSHVIISAMTDLVKKIFPQDAAKIQLAFDKGKGGKSPVIIVSRNG